MYVCVCVSAARKTDMSRALESTHANDGEIEATLAFTTRLGFKVFFFFFQSLVEHKINPAMIPS